MSFFSIFSSKPKTPEVRNLTPNPFPKLQWEPGKLAEPLEALRDFSVEEAERAIDWYYRRRSSKKWGLRFYRGGAIVMTAVAGIIPFLAQIYAPDAGGKSFINPLWSTVAIAIAATFVVLDRIGGHTSAFVRYLLTAQDLAQAVAEFRLDFESDRLAWQAAEPTHERAVALLGRIKAFLIQFHGTIRQETASWSTELQSALRQIDDAAKTSSEITRTGAVRVTVTARDKIERWTLSIDNGTENDCSGSESVVVRDLVPGLRKVRVVARIAGSERSQEAAPPVKAGDVTEVPFRFE